MVEKLYVIIKVNRLRGGLIYGLFFYKPAATFI
jgi:hypothetical protein